MPTSFCAFLQLQLLPLTGTETELPFVFYIGIEVATPAPHGDGNVDRRANNIPIHAPLQLLPLTGTETN